MMYQFNAFLKYVLGIFQDQSHPCSMHNCCIQMSFHQMSARRPRYDSTTRLPFLRDRMVSAKFARQTSGFSSHRRLSSRILSFARCPASDA